MGKFLDIFSANPVKMNQFLVITRSEPPSPIRFSMADKPCFHKNCEKSRVCEEKKDKRTDFCPLLINTRFFANFFMKIWFLIMLNRIKTVSDHEITTNIPKSEIFGCDVIRVCNKLYHRCIRG